MTSCNTCLVLFYKRNRKWPLCAYITWCNTSRSLEKFETFYVNPQPRSGFAQCSRFLWTPCRLPLVNTSVTCFLFVKQYSTSYFVRKILMERVMVDVSCHFQCSKWKQKVNWNASSKSNHWSWCHAEFLTHSVGMKFFQVTCFLSQKKWITLIIPVIWS